MGNLLTVAPNGEFIADRLDKMRPLAIREGKTGFHDGGSILAHNSLAGGNVETVKHHKRPATADTADLI